MGERFPISTLWLINTNIVVYVMSRKLSLNRGTTVCQSSRNEKIKANMIKSLICLVLLSGCVTVRDDYWLSDSPTIEEKIHELDKKMQKIRYDLEKI